jgi:hypothetical protein
MGYMGYAPEPGAVGEFTIGAADVVARAQGAATVGKGNVIRGFVVLSGSGSLVYVDDHTGATITLTGLASTAGDIEPTAGAMAIRSINGTGNASPSAGLTLRCIW